MIEDMPTIHFFAPDGYETVPMVAVARPYTTAPLRLRDALIDAQHSQTTPVPQPACPQLCHELFMVTMAFFSDHHYAPMCHDLSMSLQALLAVANASPDPQRIALERAVKAIEASAAARSPEVGAVLAAAYEVLQ